MTQFFTSSAAPAEKRNFSGLTLMSKKHSDSSNSHFPAKIKNFFRINTSANSNASNQASTDSHRERDGGAISHRPESKSAFRQSRFLPAIGRSRSPTVASEGNPLEESLSPTAHANPYFAHQGHPALRHHNEGSLPSSPPRTPQSQVDSVPAAEQGLSGKEGLARKLRRVASAPNAQGLFANGKSSDRPKTAELDKELSMEHPVEMPKISLMEVHQTPRTGGRSLPVAKFNAGGKLSPQNHVRDSVAFRRTYSSNSIKVRNVEVGPGSFDKIKLIGKGDVGKVYLVREKKSGRLYAMKGGPSRI